MSVLRASALSLTYGGRNPVEALRSVDLEVVDGQILAVLGPSGCGKTTLLRTFAGMERPDEGSIHLGDRLLDGPGIHLAPEKRAIGLVPQEGALFPHLDVARNVGFGLHELGRAQRRDRVEEMLELVGLPGHGRRRPHQLSGGQQQRVALARALAPSPEVVLLDEPFSALDTGLRASLRAQVAETLREAGTTALLVTHDQTEALEMADTVAVMREGRMVQVDAPHEVYRRPADAWIAGFVGDAVLVPGTRVAGNQVRCILGELRLTEGFVHDDGPEVIVFCRPEQIRVARTGEHGTAATVRSVRFMGPDLLVDLDLSERPSEDASATVTARWPSAIVPSPGDRMEVVLEGTVLAYAGADDVTVGAAARGAEGVGGAR